MNLALAGLKQEVAEVGTALIAQLVSGSPRQCIVSSSWQTRPADTIRGPEEKVGLSRMYTERLCGALRCVGHQRTRWRTTIDGVQQNFLNGNGMGRAAHCDLKRSGGEAPDGTVPCCFPSTGMALPHSVPFVEPARLNCLVKKKRYRGKNTGYIRQHQIGARYYAATAPSLTSPDA
jgi:hypothetical protein